MAKKKRRSPAASDQMATQIIVKTSPPTKIKKTSAQSNLAKPVDTINMVILLLLLSVAPLLVRAKVIDFTAPRIINPAVDTGLQVGLFAYYKWWLVIIGALAVILVLLYKIGVEKYQLRSSYLNAPLLLLSLLIIGSVMGAEYKSISLFGIFNQRDGSLLLLAYLGLCLAAANTRYRPWFGAGINMSLMVITVINLIIMLADFTGYDLLQADAIRTIIAPAELRDSLTGHIGNTLGNANYISGFAATLFAYFTAGTLIHNNVKDQVIAGTASLVAFTMILLSFSSSGFVTLVLIFPLFLVVLLRSWNRRRSLIAGGSLLTACLLVFVTLNSINPYIYHETVGLFLPQATTIQEISSSPVEALAPPAPEFQLPQPGWSPGTGRTYNWNETIKLTMTRPWLGYGYGTLTYYFPQDDVNKVANLMDYNRLITKPHSMYMGFGFGLGIPALLVMLALMGLHFHNTSRHLWSRRLETRHTLPVALFLFFCAFAVQALFNDPVVDAGAAFWILLGVAVSLNKEVDQPPPESII